MNDRLANKPGWQPDRDLPLDEADAPGDPLQLFHSWYNGALDDAEKTGLFHEPSAMALATADDRGRPSCRIVLLKGADVQGFVFFTNYDSSKGSELADNPWAAATLWWDRHYRQIRIEGRVEKVSSADSDAYFARRPTGSNLGALVSDQSQTIAGRSELETRMQLLETEYPEGSAVPRPKNWGGYRIKATRIEFWQGRRNRLHDRLLYSRESLQSPWTLSRLQP